MPLSQICSGKVWQDWVGLVVASSWREEACENWVLATSCENPSDETPRLCRRLGNHIEIEELPCSGGQQWQQRPGIRGPVCAAADVTPEPPVLPGLGFVAMVVAPV